jgi:hypothetical protein
LDKYGYGLHHYGISIDPADYETRLKACYNDGFKDVFTDRLPTGARIHYIEPGTAAAAELMRQTTGVCYLECVEIVEGERVFFSNVVAAARNWNGEDIIFNE